MKEQPSALRRSTQAVTPQSSARDLLRESSVGPSRPILWIDGVGGFLLLDQEEILIGQAVAHPSTDVCIVGDLSRQAAAIRRSQGDYLLQPLQPTTVDGVAVDRAQLLRDGAIIQFGSRVKLKFRRPSPLSATARLDLISLNRFKPHVDGVLLLSEACVLGPQPGSHVLCPSWSSELLLFRHAGNWYFRSLQEVNVNGEPMTGQIPMRSGMRMNGPDFSLSIE